MNFPIRSLTIAGLGLALSPLSQAMNMGPLNIQSSLGEPLKAEIIVSDVPVSETAYLAANIGNSKDFNDLGVKRNSAVNNLKIFSRRISEDKVAISIISLKPVDDSFFDIVVRLNDGKTPRLFNVNGTVTTKDDPSKNTNTTKTMDVAPTRDTPISAPIVTPAPLAVETVKEAPLLPQSVKEEEVFTSSSESATQALKENIGVANTTTLVETSPVVPVYNEAKTSTPQTDGITVKTRIRHSFKGKKGHNKSSYIVRPNDSLWKIATRVSVQSNQSVSQTMRQIKSANPHAFVNGNANQLIAGIQLVLPKPIDGRRGKNAGESRKKVQLSSITNAKASNRSVPQAQMSLVAPQDVATSGKASTTSSTTGNKTGMAGGNGNSSINGRENASLVNNILAVNQKSVGLHDELQQMNSKLESNNFQIKIQNEKLADLERRLREKKKNTTLN